MSRYIEPALHFIFWLVLIPSINIDWTSNWFDQTIRPKHPAPLSLIYFLVVFYINTFILLPKHLSKKHWIKYILYASILFIFPELIRNFLYQYVLELGNDFQKELFSRDSFIFGAPSPFFFAIQLSFLYRFALDWFKSKYSQNDLTKEQITIPYEDIQLLSIAEANSLKLKLDEQLRDHRLYLDQELSLRKLAEATKTTEKKLSYLINQELQSNFYDYINQFRIDHFKKAIKAEANQKLSILGIALNCGFSSKSSFYRSFKSQVGMSPSEYIKQESQHL